MSTRPRAQAAPAAGASRPNRPRFTTHTLDLLNICRYQYISIHLELDIKKYYMILGDMSVAVRGRPPKSVERSNVVLRIPKDLLERI
jgi:hypothetical protein